MSYKTSCCFCNSILREVISLGHHPHSDYFPQNLKEPINTYPLNLSRCTSCGLYQTDYHLNMDIMFNDEYIYDNSINISGAKHWDNLANDINNKIKKYKKTDENLTLLDIGSNSGDLISSFQRLNWIGVGIEPSPKPFEIALQRGIKTINKFFNFSIINELPFDDFDLITFTNSFPHIPNPVDTLKLSRELIKKESGIICIESPSSEKMIAEGQYDQIYHQHMTYLDIYSLNCLCKNLNLKLFDYEISEFHNGSIRYFISSLNSPYQISSKLTDYLSNIDKEDYLSEKSEKIFKEKCENHRTRLRDTLRRIKEENKSVGCVSAPAKGNTILNYCGINNNDIMFASEANKLKIGRFTPLSNIPIISDSQIDNYKPDYLIIMAWNFFNEIKTVVSPKVRNAKFLSPFDVDDN